MAAYDVAVIGGGSYDLARIKARWRNCHIEERRRLLTPDKTVWQALVKERIKY